MIPAFLLTSLLGLHFTGDTQACLGKGVIGTAIGRTFRGGIYLEEEVAATIGIAPEQALTVFTNVSVGFPTHPIRPYVLVGLGEMTIFSAESADHGFAWNFGSGVEMFHGNIGVRFDVRYISGSFTYTRFVTGFVVKTH